MKKETPEWSKTCWGNFHAGLPAEGVQGSGFGVWGLGFRGSRMVGG